MGWGTNSSPNDQNLAENMIHHELLFYVRDLVHERLCHLELLGNWYQPISNCFLSKYDIICRLLETELSMSIWFYDLRNSVLHMWITFFVSVYI